VMAPSNIEARVEYGAATTPWQACHAGIPTEFEAGSLKPNTRYDYRLLSRDASALATGSFHTARSPGSPFTFALQGDSHPERLGKMFSAALYAQTLNNAAADAPDFYLMLGDDFSIDPLIERQTLNPTAVDGVYVRQRRFLSALGRTTPLFLVNGNHEEAARFWLDDSATNAAVLAGSARTRFFPLPAPDAFYRGDAEPVSHLGLPRDYYAWTWGDALFVVIDFYWHSPGLVDHAPGVQARREPWKATLGETQYRWLAQTLTDSKSRWKFVFCHHVLGTGRGGVESAPFFEWGGQDRRGDVRFSEQRPGWPMPIHELMAKTGVTVFFQGHDHLFAHQVLDGVVYQTCPCPADPTYTAFNRDAYLSGDLLPNSGHLRVSVAPERVRVDYVRAFLPGEGTNAAVAFSYTVQK